MGQSSTRQNSSRVSLSTALLPISMLDIVQTCMPQSSANSACVTFLALRMRFILELSRFLFKIDASYQHIAMYLLQL